MCYVLPGDDSELAGETPDDLANQASRVLQKIWAEARERRDPQVNLEATLEVLLACVLLAAILAMVTVGARWIRYRLTAWLGERLKSVPTGNWFSRVAILLPAVIRRLSVLVGWLLGLFALLSFLTYSLDWFVFTRPASENLSQSISQLLIQIQHGVTDSLPGLFASALIFLVAWVVTRVSTEIFAHAEAAPIGTGMLNVHTAPATRRIVNASLWLFAVAMAYPYLPGSHTQAFQGLSVILGLMVSIGAYKLVVYVDSEQPARRALVASNLHAAIQDTFNRYGVQIMSPQYFVRPATPKLAPESNWYAPPARRPNTGEL